MGTSSDVRILIRAMAASFVVLLLAAAGQSDEALMSDLYTLACLTLEEPNTTVQACKRLQPLSAPELDDALQKWEARNAPELRNLKSACENRLVRVYAADPARIQAAKQQAREIQQGMLQQLLLHPNANAQLNCRGFIRDYSQGSPKIDGEALRKLIDAVRDSKPK